MALLAGLLLGTVAARDARAGGFEAPGIGVEAMGRGGAFTAKASDGSALEYNVAGFARQRGTRLHLDGKLVLNSQSFSRLGNYPAETNPMTMTAQPWSGMPYPTVSNTHGLSGAPVFAISTDFGILDRWTFYVGMTTPSASDSNRTFPTTVNGNWPAPQRYDLYNANLFVLYPTLGAAVRVTKWFDIGFALQMVYGRFDLKATAYADASAMLCPGREFSGCDSTLNIKTAGFTATGVLGLMFHPLEQLHIGLHIRGPVYLNTSGDVTATPPAALPVVLDPGNPENPAKGTLQFRLPWVVRLGIRYAFMKDRREQGDIELNGTYESWREAQGVGDTLEVPQLGFFSDIKATLYHRYRDTGSVRLGGSYNVYFSDDKRLNLRLGLFYDSSATRASQTRLDFDTLDKVGLGVGAGFKFRGITISAAYALVASPDRIVGAGEGRQQVINGTTGGTTGSDGNPTSVFNEGRYSARTNLIFLGLNFHFDELMRKQRVDNYDGLGTSTWRTKNPVPVTTAP